MFAHNRPQACSFFQPPTTSLPAAIFGASLPSILYLQDQPTWLFVLSTLLPTSQELPDSSDKVHPSTTGSTESVGLPHLPLLGLLLPSKEVGLQGLRCFFCEWAEKRQGAKPLLKMQNQGVKHTPSRTGRNHPPMSGVKPWTTWKPCGLGGEPEPSGLSSAGADSGQLPGSRFVN